METEYIQKLLQDLYDNQNISIGVHGTAILPDREQKHQKNILENGLMCRHGDIRRTVAFQDRGMIHAHGNIEFERLISYKYNKGEIGYLYEEKKEDKITRYEPKQIKLEKCSFIIAIPKEMSTIDDELFSGPWQTFARKFAYNIDDLRIGTYKDNEGRPINPKYIVGYYMNGDISNFTFNSKFYGFEFDENNQPTLNTTKIEEENKRIKQLNENKPTKKTQELGKETHGGQKHTQAKIALLKVIRGLLNKRRSRESGKGI